MRVFAVCSLTTAFLCVFAHEGAGQAAFPSTTCDAALANSDLHFPLSMDREDGTKAFSYGGNGTPFVTTSGGAIRLTFMLLFAPGLEATVRLGALDESCGGGGSSGAVFNYAFSNLTTVEHTFTYDVSSGEIAFDGPGQQTLPLGVPRYFWIEVWDGAAESSRASYSYLVDLANPQNPGP